MPPLPTSSSCWRSAAMLAVAFGHPRGRVEAAVGVVCAGATLATGLLTLDRGPRRGRPPGAGGRVPGHDPGRLGRLCPRRRLRGRSPAGRAVERRVGRPTVHRCVRAGRGRHGHAQPGRHRGAADPGRARRRHRAVGPRRAGHLCLPPDGELRLAPAPGLQPDQPARPAPHWTSRSPASRSGWRRCSRSYWSWSTSGCDCCSAIASPCLRPVATPGRTRSRCSPWSSWC